MCHFIQPKQDSNFFGFNNFIFLGAKAIKIFNYSLQSYFNEKNYKISEINDEGISIIDQETQQDAVMNIKIYDQTSKKITEYPLLSQIKAGMHIAPLTEFDQIPVIDSSKSSIIVPVIFFPADIIFYDGNDASVKSFIIPAPKILYDNFNETINLNVKEFNCKLYEELYTRLITMLKGIKIDLFQI